MLIDQLKNLVEPEVQALGFILWGIEMDAYSVDTGAVTLRIFIDHEEGISIDDCQEVSQAVSAILDVEDPISGTYSLEVSSPGMNRRVFNAKQAGALEGFKVKVQLHQPTENNRRRFEGAITEVNGELVTIKTEEGEVIGFDFANVDKMRVVPKF
ncbi:ribosome maturation factor RimP [Fastidiosibacter lacustris]|uniref:ribosome maturation factor RimP n=1 Tax=Fastidiosibacter lacustris TaxID=2056695 RepID=UPI000E357168|nr:ribosome maturation factor RimP [Fastidiosibacter lacustris]